MRRPVFYIALQTPSEWLSPAPSAILLDLPTASCNTLSFSSVTRIASSTSLVSIRSSLSFSSAVRGDMAFLRPVLPSAFSRSSPIRSSSHSHSSLSSLRHISSYAASRSGS